MSLIENTSVLSTQSMSGNNENVKSILFKVGKKVVDKQYLFRSYQHDENLKLSVSKMTEEQVRSSQIYTQLALKIEKMQEVMIISEMEHKKRMKILDDMIKGQKSKTHQIKYNVWQIKNQILNLQEQLANSLQQASEIQAWLSSPQQQLDLQQQHNQFQNNQQDQNNQTENAQDISYFMRQQGEREPCGSEIDDGPQKIDELYLSSFA